MTQRNRHWLFVLLVSLSLSAIAQAGSFSYQGRLDQDGAPFSGTANLQFRLFDAAAGGSQIGSPQTFPDWPVNEGLFQVELDFGLEAFDGGERWLAVGVNGSLLSLRQVMNAAQVAEAN